jgi:hypothetical protein
MNGMTTMTQLVRRRSLLASSALWLMAPTLRANPIEVEVWKAPNCVCCKEWVSHMQAAGFAVQVHDTGNTAMRHALAMPMRFASCHTARVAGYVIEGHVPAPVIQRLLRERPQALGLAVPGMPVGSPGMDGPGYGVRRDAYDVLLILEGGASRVYQRYA